MLYENKKLIIFFLIIAILAFPAIKIISAGELFFDSSPPTTNIIGTELHDNDCAGIAFTSQFSGIVNQVNTRVLSNWGSYFSGTLTLYFYDRTNDLLLATTTASYGLSAWGYADLNFFLPNISITSGNQYYVAFKSTTLPSFTALYMARGTSNFPAGFINAYKGCSATTTTGNGYNPYPYIKVFNNTPPPSISLDFPTATTTADFNSWQVSFNDTTGNVGDKIEINYTGDNIPLFIDSTIAVVSSSTAYQITKSQDLPIGNYTAYANLYERDTNNLLAQSNVVNFSITTSTTNQYQLPPIATTTAQTITCDPDSNFFSYSLCYMFQYLFIPPQNSLSQFQNVYNDIKNKPPFGYFGAIYNDLSLLNASTSTSTIDLSEAGQVSIFNDVKTYLKWLFWFIFAFWLFKKIANLNL